METRANYSAEKELSNQHVSVPGGIAGEVHENAMQEKVGESRFHVFIQEKMHPYILNIYKDYSVSGYFVMILVSFIAIAIVVGILMGIYLLVSQ